MKHRYLISGGGTGGHIFPALAIAGKIKEENPDADILFIGARDKMEMELVPRAGYRIEGLHIYGVSRALSLRTTIRNLKLPFVFLKSQRRAMRLIRDFAPDIAIGVGGFASASALRAANRLRVPTLLQEQNSYPGLTNKMLARTARTICVAYDNMERFFPAEKIVKTGNPVRTDILNLKRKEPQSYLSFQHNDILFGPDKKTVLIFGGSLGAKTLNDAVLAHLSEFAWHGLQLLWQTGREYYKGHENVLLRAQEENKNVRIVPFIENMNDAYGIADLIVSRAGALTIAEVAIVGKPVILVPYPHAAENHQTRNAEALADRDAAILVPDDRVAEDLMLQLFKLAEDTEHCTKMAQNIRTFARPNAIDLIYNEIKNITG